LIALVSVYVISENALVAEAGADGHALAADGATAAQDGGAALGLHARAEPVRLHAFAAIGLKCALGHKNALLFPEENLRLDGKSQVYRRLGQESSANCLEAGTAPSKPSWNSSQESLDQRHNSAGGAALNVSVAAFCSDSGNTLAASFTSNGATQSAEKKLCERLIAISPKCATIGTVQESFPASHGTSLSTPQGRIRGQISGIQAVVSGS
jgi:hypothetical protein